MVSALVPVALAPLPRGDARDWRIQVYTDDSLITPQDLTGATLTWAAALASGGGPVIAKTIGAGIVLDDQTVTGTAGVGRGWFTLSLEHADTARLPPQTAPIPLVWSLRGAGADGRPFTEAVGSLNVIRYPTS